MEFEIDDDYKVEHSEGFVLTEDQYRKLIEEKVERYKILYMLDKVRECKDKLA